MGSSPNMTTTQSPQIPGWLGGDSRQIVNSLMGSMFPGGQLQSYGQNLNQNVAGFSQAQNTAQQGAAGAYGQSQATAQGGAQANQTLTNPSLLYANSNPYLQSQMQAANQAATNSYEFGTAPSEMSSAVQSGAFGGSADAVQRLQNQFGFGTALANADTSMANSNYQNSLGVLNNASQAAPGIASGLYNPAQGLNAFGQEQQQQQQNVLNTNTSNAWQQQNFPYQLLNQGTGILTPYLNAFSGSKTISPNTASK